MPRILILEDDTDFAELLKLDLESAGHEVEICESGEAAYERLVEVPFDLLIADVYIWKDGRLRQDGGLLLTGRVKRLYASEAGAGRLRIPVLVISGAIGQPGQTQIPKVARSLGADAVLAKPFTTAELAAELARLLPQEPV